MCLASCVSFAQSSEENKIELIRYISYNAEFLNANTRGEADKYVSMVSAAKKINESQKKIVILALKNADKNEQDFDESIFIHLALKADFLTPAHVEVFKKIANGARSGNDFNENIALTSLLRTPSITITQVERLISIFRYARYNNAIDDTIAFLEILDGEI